MTECYQTSLEFPSVKRRKVALIFPVATSAVTVGPCCCARLIGSWICVGRVARALGDGRRQASCEFSAEELIKQRVYGLALGYEDLNDHLQLRDDLVLQTAVSRDTKLASSATLCRLEHRANRDSAVAIHEILFQQFIQSHDKAPKRLILDFDATDTPLHGEQEQRFFHGYYDHYCYLPLYVFCGRHLLVSYLRPSNLDPARHAWGILSLLVKALRAHWPKTEIIFRGDSGFCRWQMLRWCERHDVCYIVGLAKNPRGEAPGLRLD